MIYIYTHIYMCVCILSIFSNIFKNLEFLDWSLRLVWLDSRVMLIHGSIKFGERKSSYCHVSETFVGRDGERGHFITRNSMYRSTKIALLRGSCKWTQREWKEETNCWDVKKVESIGLATCTWVEGNKGEWRGRSITIEAVKMREQNNDELAEPKIRKHLHWSLIAQFIVMAWELVSDYL